MEKKIVDLMFVLFILRVFKFRNPIKGVSFIKAACSLFEMDENMMQALLLRLMKENYTEGKIICELAYRLHCNDVAHYDIIRLTGYPKSTLYRKISLFKQLKYVPVQLNFSEEEHAFVFKFLRHFKTIGELFI